MKTILLPSEKPHETDDLSGESSRENDNSGEAEARMPCVLAFNSNDPSGAGGLAADAQAMASVGTHVLSVCTGSYVRDTGRLFDHYALDDEAVAEQARAILEDVPVQVIKVGFAGVPENLGAIASAASDYPDVPLVAYMPDLSWWESEQIEAYLDAFRELLMPQTWVLVGNHSTLRRWLLPDWAGERPPGARDLAKAADELGAPYTLVTGITLPGQFIDNVLATPNAVLASEKFERLDATFAGVGDTLSATLAALLATGTDLAAAVTEALSYMDRCLDAGFRPGMGNVLPNRMFWAQLDEDEGTETVAAEPPSASDFALPPHDTRH